MALESVFSDVFSSLQRFSTHAYHGPLLGWRTRLGRACLFVQIVSLQFVP